MAHTNRRANTGRSGSMTKNRRGTVTSTGLDTVSKRQAAIRYIETLSSMNPDPVLQARIDAFRRQLAKP